MKYIRKFNEKESSIEDWCKDLRIKDYDITSDGVNVNTIVDIREMKLLTIPIEFNIVFDSFTCGFNKLTSLRGSPKKIHGGFYCGGNDLTSLNFSPKIISGDFHCDRNKITSLEGCTQNEIRNFDCGRNLLTNLIGGPPRISGFYSCRYNELISLEGLPILNIDHSGIENFACKGNPISVIYELFGNYKRYIDSLDYNYLRGDKIIKLRFREALEEIGKKLPESIQGYKYI